MRTRERKPVSKKNKIEKHSQNNMYGSITVQFDKSVKSADRIREIETAIEEFRSVLMCDIDGIANITCISLSYDAEPKGVIL